MGLARLIDARRDDVQVWFLPENPQVDCIGRGSPDGVMFAMLHPCAICDALGAPA